MSERAVPGRVGAPGATRALAVLLVAGLLPIAAGPALGDEGPDFARGERLWRKCATCHTVEANGRNRVGPRLHGLFGRPAGAVPDFRYTEALRGSGIVWTDESLDRYLKDSEAMVPGTKMYGGLSLDEDRAALIAWLRRATGAGDGAAPTR